MNCSWWIFVVVFFFFLVVVVVFFFVFPNQRRLYDFLSIITKASLPFLLSTLFFIIARPYCVFGLC